VAVGIDLFNLVKLYRLSIIWDIKILPVAEVRTHFSSVLKKVESGKGIGISFGRKKVTIAVIIPIEEYKKIRILSVD
jgi:hypothetical protein